jgi:hypothetical protein
VLLLTIGPLFESDVIDSNIETQSHAVCSQIPCHLYIYLILNAYRLLVGKPEGKKPLGRPRRMWVDNIRMDLGELGWGDVDWIGLAQDRNRWRAPVNSVLNLRVP